MHGGTIVDVLDRSEATQQNILALALGHELTEAGTQAKQQSRRQ
jgi:hypothetical protein